MSILFSFHYICCYWEHLFLIIRERPALNELTERKNLIYIQIFCRCRYPSLRRCRRCRCTRSYRIHFVNIVLLGNINIPLSVFLLLSHFLQGCHQLAFLKYTDKTEQFLTFEVFFILNETVYFVLNVSKLITYTLSKWSKCFFFNSCAFY